MQVDKCVFLHLSHAWLLARASGVSGLEYHYARWKYGYCFPLSDLNPVCLASGADLTAQSMIHGVFTLPIKEFLLKYRTTALPADAIITKLTIQLPAEGAQEVTKSYK